MDALLQKMDPAWLESRRLEGARLLEQGVGAAEVARHLSVSRQAVYLWRSALLVNGDGQQLKAKKLGRRERLNADQIDQLRSWLEQGPRAAECEREVWTILLVRKLIALRFGCTYSDAGCWGLLRRAQISLKDIAVRLRSRPIADTSEGEGPVSLAVPSVPRSVAMQVPSKHFIGSLGVATNSAGK